MRSVAFEARDLCELGRHAMRYSHHRIRMGIGTTCSAKQSPVLQGLVQCRHRPYAMPREPQGHRCRRNRQDIHREQGVRPLPIEIRRDTCCPTGESRAQEEGKLIRKQARRHSDTRVAHPPGRTIGNEWSRAASNSVQIPSRPRVASSRGEEDADASRHLLGVVAEESLKEKIDAVSALKQSGCNLKRLALGALSGEARGKDGDTAHGSPPGTIDKVEGISFTLSCIRPLLESRPKMRTR